ncbi:MAG: hypothetical protein RLZZ403_963 [Pseudomonadota bacterium]|jgi:hypothetical protein
MSGNSQVSTLESAKTQAPAVAARGVANKVKANGHDVALSGKKASITIHPSEGMGGEEAVLVGVNGYMYQIPRGEPQEIPVEVLEILEHSIGVHLSTDKAGEVKERRVPRFAYTVHSVEKLNA